MNKILKFIVLFSLLGFAIGSFAKDITLVDIAGRSVTVPKGAKRVVLIEGLAIYAIAPLFGKNGNMFKNVVGIGGDLPLYYPDAHRKYMAKFPEMKNIADLGNPWSDGLNIEKIISLKADVALMPLHSYFKFKESNAIQKLQKAGIPTVFIDFRQDPTRNTIPSLLILSKIFNKQEQGFKVIDFYIGETQRIYAKVASKKENEKPLVFIESAAAAGWGDCCGTFGNRNLGHFISIAGGRNLGSELFGNLKGKVSPEYIFKKDPDIIIATGSDWTVAMPDTKAILLGYEADMKDVKGRIAYLANRKGWGELKAVKNKRFYGIYHQFYNSPYNFIALQYFAKALYPRDFKDLDPTETFRRFHDEFLPVDYSGHFWGEL